MGETLLRRDSARTELGMLEVFRAILFQGSVNPHKAVHSYEARFSKHFMWQKLHSKV